ncbi:DUF4232 domain-containing protein [Kutzneria buriramensis]|uniref:Uncharacterized protein DUF4232 n=1 Tax=Kutzneria buriramensis TaxID=1045776 RepID=A0A3E0HP46_9PSEU|nr:DUF4232 domain-containing protein [Kutzneria buriramensis]REH48209.1 uncharacterized protein DUF4232 [Kutzneria buriramensis]
MTRIRTAFGAVAMVATAVMLTACGNSGLTAGSTAASTTTSTPPPTTTTATKATTSAQNVSSGNGKITADLNHQQGPGSEILAVTNKGTGPLTVNGWPALSFLNAANGSLAVPVNKVNQPGAASPITLQPGQSAFAGVKLIPGDKGANDTFVATTTNLALPGAPAVVVNLIDDNGHASEYPELDLKSVQVGTFQPAMQGVSPDAW